MTPDRSRRPTEARLRLYVVVFFMTAMCPPGALGQEMRVTGTVVDSITGTAIPGALVILTPPDGAAVSTASSETGEFMIGAPKLTKARISVSAMGMEAWFSEPLPEADSVDLGMIPLQADPYTLQGLDVSVEARCDASPQSLLEAYRVMGFVRSRLHQIRVNDQREGYEYVIQLVRQIRHWRSERWDWRPDTVRVRLPFAVPAHEPSVLHDEGFAVAANDTVNEYRAPNAAWLASEEFQDSYCLATVSNDDRSTEVQRGVRFWPKSAPTKVDVEGTIWLNADDVPTSVTFRYVRLEPFVEANQLEWLRGYHEKRESDLIVTVRLPRIDPERHGGQITFSEVATGLWMTTQWEIRGVRLVSAGRQEDEYLRIVPRVEPLVTKGTVLAILPGEGRSPVPRSGITPLGSCRVSRGESSY